MNKYILLVGDVYYPRRWEDFKGYFESVQEAKKWVEDNENEESCRWAEIIEVDKVVLEGSTEESDRGLNRKKNKWTWYNPDE